MSDVAIEAAKSGESSVSNPLSFYKALDPKGRRTFWACSAGWALDGMDFMLFPLVIGSLVSIWHIDLKAAGSVATITLLCSALGGWIAGYASDRFGRVRVMQITVLLFSLGSLLSAFSQDITQLTLSRALLGFGFGGEAAVAAVALSETMPAKFRGRGVGAWMSSYAVGWALAVIIQAVAFTFVPPELAWRLMFAIGVAPALLVFYVRRFVEEPTIFSEGKNLESSTVSERSLTEIFRPAVLRATVLGSFLTIGAQGGYYAMMTWLPQFLKAERHVSVIGSVGYLVPVIGGCFLGYFTGGIFSDRLGRRPVFMIFSVCAAGLAYVYTHVQISDASMILLGLPLGYFACGYYSAVMPCLNEMFPTRIRGAGVGFTYNAGRAVGGFFPFLVGAATVAFSLAEAISVFAIAAYGLMFVTALFLPETNGRSLDGAASN